MVGWLQELTARWHPYLHHLLQHQPFLHVYSTILSIRSAVPGRLNSVFCGMVPRRWIAGKHALSESLCLWTYSVLCRACQSIQARDHHPAALSRHGALMNSWVSRSTRVACAHCCRALHRVASHTLRWQDHLLPQQPCVHTVEYGRDQGIVPEPTVMASRRTG